MFTEEEVDTPGRRGHKRGAARLWPAGEDFLWATHKLDELKNSEEVDMSSTQCLSRGVTLPSSA